MLIETCLTTKSPCTRCRPGPCPARHIERDMKRDAEALKYYVEMDAEVDKLKEILFAPCDKPYVVRMAELTDQYNREMMAKRYGIDRELEKRMQCEVVSNAVYKYFAEQNLSGNYKVDTFDTCRAVMRIIAECFGMEEE